MNANSFSSTLASAGTAALNKANELGGPTASRLMDKMGTIANTIADVSGFTASTVDFDKKKLKVDALLSNAKPSARSLSTKYTP
jgi:hypothetical protein